MHILLYAANPGAFSIMRLIYSSLESRGEKPVWILEGNCGKYPVKGKRIYNMERALDDCLVTPSEVYTLLGVQVDNMDRTHFIIDRLNQLGITSIFIMDHWMNDIDNFLDSSGKWHLPTKILCIDKEMQTRFRNAGINPHFLEIVGHPALEETREREVSESRRRQLMEKLEITANTKIHSVFLDPLRQRSGRTYGYDEFDVLEFIFNSTCSVGNGITTIVKPHPRHTKLERELLTQKFCQPAVKFIEDVDPIELIAISDRVLGSTSILLLHSLVLGRPTASLQPNRSPFGKLRTNVYLEQILIDNQSGLDNFLRRGNRSVQINIPRNACDRICDILTQNPKANPSAN